MGEDGFYQKYNVERVDGKPITGPTFTLELDGHDPHALVALAAYASSIRPENATLADDLEAHIASLGDEP